MSVTNKYRTINLNTLVYWRQGFREWNRSFVIEIRIRAQAARASIINHPFHILCNQHVCMSDKERQSYINCLKIKFHRFQFKLTKLFPDFTSLVNTAVIFGKTQHTKKNLCFSVYACNDSGIYFVLFISHIILVLVVCYAYSAMCFAFVPPLPDWLQFTIDALIGQTVTVTVMDEDHSKKDSFLGR